MRQYVSVNRKGKNLYVGEYDDYGVKQYYKTTHFPDLYLNSSQEVDKTITDIHGKPVKRFSFSSYDEYRNFITSYDDVMEVHGNISPAYSFINSEYNEYRDSYLTTAIRVVSFDIEVNSDEFPKPEDAKYPIDAITLHDIVNDEYHVIGYGEWEKSKSIHNNLNIVYYKCKNEKDLLKTFLTVWKSLNIDIITGWYCRLFDIPYIVNRLKKLFGDGYEKNLSPFNIVEFKEVNLKFGSVDAYDIFGVPQLDMLDVFKKFGYNTYGEQENYTLNHIAYVVLDQQKLSYDEVQSLKQLSDENYQKYIDYNIKDVILVSEIAKETGFMNLAIQIAYMAGCNFSDTLGTTAVWDAFLYNEMKQQGIMIPPNNRNNTSFGYSGGFVKPPKIGLSEWVVSFDVNSMYPNLFVMLNMSPETIVDVDSDVNIDKCFSAKSPFSEKYCVASNGARFLKEKIGIIPQVVSRLYNQRKDVRYKMKSLDRDTTEYNILFQKQMALKILLNSLYGASGNQYFRYFDNRIAEGITTTGRYLIQTTEKFVNDYLQNVLETDNDYVVAIDTDSNYYELKELVDKVGLTDKKKIIDFIDQVCELKIKKILDNAFSHVSHVLNSRENSMVMDRESISEASLWTGKKHYIMLINDTEGKRYDEPELLVKGMSAKKSSYPEKIRKELKRFYRLFLEIKDQNILKKEIETFKKMFNEMDYTEIAFPRGINNIDKYSDTVTKYTKGTPIHVRGAILYNNLLKQHKLTSLKPIQDSDKMKFLYLRTPNPIGENVIGFIDGIPTEFGLEKYIDYSTQFEKVFKDEMAAIFKSLGWSLKNTATLEGFFV